MQISVDKENSYISESRTGRGIKRTRKIKMSGKLEEQENRATHKYNGENRRTGTARKTGRTERTLEQGEQGKQGEQREQENRESKENTRTGEQRE